jgi:hypothetical protein
VTYRENVLRSPIAQAAINARKTHCKRGHAFTPANTMRSPKARRCRTCHNQASLAAYRAKAKAVA